jgi:predicted flap endonuclease-1-like 5' DNA nuclease
MTALIAYYWYGLLIAFGIGLVTAWLAWHAPAIAEPVAFEPEEDAVEPVAAPHADVDGDAVASVIGADPIEEEAPAAPEPDAVEPVEVPGMDEPVEVPTPAEAFEADAPADMAQPLDDELGPALAAAKEWGVPDSPPVDDALPQPDALEEPRKAPDDLMVIKGVGPQLARLLNGLGVNRYDDIAGWMPEDIEMIDSHLGVFRGRIIRDEWIQQARLLAKGDMETFNQRYGHLPF